MLHASNRKYLFSAVLSGVLLLLSYPPFNLEFLAWIAFVPWLMILYEEKNLQNVEKLDRIRGIMLSPIIFWMGFMIGDYATLFLPVLLGSTLLLGDSRRRRAVTNLQRTDEGLPKYHGVPDKTQSPREPQLPPCEATPGHPDLHPRRHVDGGGVPDVERAMAHEDLRGARLHINCENPVEKHPIDPAGVLYWDVRGDVPDTSGELCHRPRNTTIQRV